MKFYSFNFRLEFFTLSRSSPSLRDSAREFVIVADFSLVLFNDCNNSLFSKILPVALAKSFHEQTDYQTNKVINHHLLQVVYLLI